MEKIVLNIDNSVMLPNGKVGRIIHQLGKENPNEETYFEIRDEDFETDHYKESELSPDLFEHYDNLPKELKKVLDKYPEVETYDDCEKMLKDMNKIGYTFDYYLDAIPYNLRKI
jgi:hypothetical protein